MLIHGHGTGIARITAFTVLELLVTLAVATLLLVTGLPSFQQFSQRQQMIHPVLGLLQMAVEHGAVGSNPGRRRPLRSSQGL